jgi:hypothetical protein
MKSNLVGCTLAALLLLPMSAGPASAQMEEIVVTAQRAYDSAPDVNIVKRADHLITEVTVTCDTRDADRRRAEMRQTLRDMVAEAKRSQTISLGLGESILGELKESNFDEIIVPEGHVDTSRATVVIKTTISADDSFDSATSRIKDFIARTPKAGRAEIVRAARWDLTIIGPEQYHDALVSRIAAQSKKAAELFGPGYGVSIDGLERSVSWVQTGPLDLALYISYSLRVAPLGSHQATPQ